MIVGTGSIAGAHARAYESHAVGDRAEIVGAVDVDAVRARAFAADNSISWHGTDYRAALTRLKPDVIHVCTPPALHKQQTVDGLNSGAWVICEKPLCASLAELDEIQHAEQASGGFCAVVFQWRYGSGMRHVQTQMRRGTLGRPLLAVCNTLWYRDDNYYSVDWRGRWATEFGGPTVGHGIHMMDSLLWLLGDWEEVTARATTLARSIEVEDLSIALVKFRSGALATIVNSVLSPRQETYLRIDCELGTVEATGLYSVSNWDWKWTSVQGNGAPAPADDEGGHATGAEPDPAVAWGAIPEDVPSDHATQISAVYDDMDAGRRPLTSGCEARRTLEFLSAIYKSAFTGTTVRAGDIGKADRFYDALSGNVGDVEKAGPPAG